MDAAILRILDANLNRAREALRVVEEYARFVLDDRATAARVKAVRHDLRQVALDFETAANRFVSESGDGGVLLAARDIVGDVGRDVKTAAELQRGSTDEVVRAAFARFGEAARALGEYGKLVSPAASAAAEALRYRMYELEPQIVLRGALRARFAAVRLYVILTEALCAPGPAGRRDWLQTAEAAIRGGAGCVQLREKNLPDAELLRRAGLLRELTAQSGVLFIINDRPDIARLARADGVHVGQDDLSVRDARRIGGGQLLVGKSTHTLEQFYGALAEEPDYIAVGPMFPTATKPQAHVAGVETVAAVASLTSIPIVAIGGITAANAKQIFDAGANCVAVCAGIIGATDPEAAARAFGR